MALATFAAAALTTGGAARADLAAGAACAAKLPVPAKLVYDAVAPALKPDSVMKDVVIAQVRPLVLSGKLDRASARAAAEAAGPCLKLVK
ncbi:hypothetical protein [Methyloraptor flagellatus]|uniref:Uncharacterized protein n=1 Tax=Methyloraptor flagellatus TaxID=3162530 RepID=A0AAU7X983_9HYPH